MEEELLIQISWGPVTWWQIHPLPFGSCPFWASLRHLCTPVSNSSSLSPPTDSPSIPALRLPPVSFVQAVPLPPVALSKPVAPALRTDSEGLSASAEGQGRLHWG